MTEHPWEEQEEQPARRAAPDKETETQTPAACGASFRCPYGQPQPTANKGTRTLLSILVGIAAAFVIGFGSYAIFLSVQQDLGGEDSRFPEADLTSAVEEGAGSGTDGEPENPVGTGTNADFAGLTLADPAEDSLSPREIYKKLAPSVASVVLHDADADTDYDASAVVLTKDGYLLTTAHAIGYSREGDVTVVIGDGKAQKAVVVGYDQSTDIAVLKVEQSGLTPAVLGRSSSVSPGDWVYAVGAAGDGDTGKVLTRGILSAASRTLHYDGVNGITFLQTDASVGTGGSGGALVNDGGQVIGISISSGYLETDGSESYAIPMEQVQSVVEDIIRGGYVSGRVRLGISGITVTQREAESYGVPRGVMIVSIAVDSAFSGTDAKVGDIITAIDGTTVSNMEDVQSILRKHKAGDRAEITLYRVEEEGDGQEFAVSVKLLDDRGQSQQ